MKKITVSRVSKSDGTNDTIAVATTGTVWSRSIQIKGASGLAFAIKAESPTGTPDIDVYVEQTHIDPSTVSTGEGVVGDESNGWVATVGSAKVADITSKDAWYDFVVTPLTFPWIRLKFIGQGSNPADCVVTPNISIQWED